ncbi:MAG: argininosuccinate synthase [Planctomycetaceae bacterium]|nr:argininosuccinate synthase [Planctomycetaceae bacterium]
MSKRCVLAYSGGLDTSVILGWLIEQGYEVVAVYVDLGQPCEDREAILKKARDCGAAKALIVDVREELCRDLAFPTREGCSVFAHGATGKGNDQCRFQLAAEALDPGIKVLAPWRIAAFRQRFPGRQELIEFCAAKNIPVKASKGKPYSSDENCLHTSYEAGALEELTTDGFGLVEFGMTVSPQAAPDAVETVRIDFERGVPVRVNGKTLAPHEIVLELNAIGGRNGVGRTDIVENRLVGMKSRGVYEAPGMTLLYEAHRLVEQMTLDRDLVHLRDRLAPEVAEMVYYGFWYCAKMDALLAFIREAQKPVTGTVALNLYKGNILVKSRESGQSLYDAAIASMEGGGSYDQTDAEGFLRILGLPLRVQGQVRPRRG